MGCDCQRTRRGHKTGPLHPDLALCQRGHSSLSLSPQNAISQQTVRACVCVCVCVMAQRIRERAWAQEVERGLIATFFTRTRRNVSGGSGRNTLSTPPPHTTHQPTFRAKNEKSAPKYELGQSAAQMREVGGGAHLASRRTMAFLSISTLAANCDRIPCIVSGPAIPTDIFVLYFFRYE